MLNKEYYALHNSSEKRLVELESRCKEQSDKLAVYEKLEQELDDVIMQAAEGKGAGVGDCNFSLKAWMHNADGILHMKLHVFPT